jgi:rRNA maturation endonuclease Nob1
MRYTALTALILLIIAYISICTAWEKVVVNKELNKCPLCGHTTK